MFVVRSSVISGNILQILPNCLSLSEIVFRLSANPTDLNFQWFFNSSDSKVVIALLFTVAIYFFNIKLFCLCWKNVR